MTKAVRIFWKFYFICLGVFVLFLLMLNWGWIGDMPSIDDIENPTASLASQVYAQDGTLMGKYYLEDRINVKYRDISKYVIDALVATEDKRFYDHSGIDAISLARVFLYLGSQGGGSTITIQTAKNLFTENWSTRNILLRGIQKIKEGIIAVKLERSFTKEEIITLYLNTVEFGDNVFGIRNAAKTFFQKEPDRLSVEEAAVLIGMVNAPYRYNPRVNPKLALDRRNLVLSRMVEINALKEADATVLKNKPIDINFKKLDETTGLGPYFRMVLSNEMKKWCKTHKKSNGENYNLYKDGLKIYTGINPRMQQYAEEAVAKQISYMQKLLNQQENIKKGTVWKNFENVLDAAMRQSERWRNLKNEGLEENEIRKNFFIKTPMKIFAWNNKRQKDTVMTPYDSIKYHRQMMQAGFMVMDPLSGEVRAWVGGIDFKTYKYDHVNISTKRQVGSSIKPLLYSLAIEEAGFTPNTMVDDIQQSFGGYGLVPATSKTCKGYSMPMASALMWSRNCATAYILKQLDQTGNNGAKRFVDFLRKLNFQSKLDPYPSIALGATEISLQEMMQGYSMFPGRGFNVKPMLVTRIEDRNGNVIEAFTPERKEVISDITAYSTIKMMQGVVLSGTGRGVWQYGVQGEIAGKTGTTNDNSDAWFMGYTPQLLAGGWVGADDRFIRLDSKAGEGASAALPIWAYFFSKVMDDPNCGLDRTVTFTKPENMSNDIIMDWINGSNPALGGEGEDVGTGTSTDYENMNKEEIGAESEFSTDKKAIVLPPAPANILPASSDNKSPASKPTDNKTPATKPPEKPKAVLPKKPGGGN